MAKTKQRLKRTQSSSTIETRSEQRHALPRWVLGCRRICAALLGALVVYVAYFPSDSILVETGDALWFSALSLILCTMTLATEPMVRRSRGVVDGQRQNSISARLGNGPAIDLLAWSLAAWMMVAALATCPPGNLRQATNEAWFWVAAAAVLSSARRLLSDRESRTVVLAVIGAVAMGMAVHALHQEWISLPRMRAEYLADPDGVLRTAGIDAPRGTARRMVFANRLLDGGPTATFALANSLAAMLMVAVLVPIGLLRTGRHHKRPLWINSVLVLMAIVGTSALFATRSRSALVACTLAVAWMWFRKSRSSVAAAAEPRAGERQSTGLLKAVCLIGAIGGAILVGLLIWGDDEWMTAAPASLEFRLQYWKSTLALLADHPLMGSGPGGFQSMYLQYRLPIANETIVDPHNFFFETLAAGGLVAGVLLVLLSAACWRVSRGLSDRRRECQASVTEGEPLVGSAAPWIGYGAFFSLGLVWLFGALSGRLPDFEAAVFSVPLAIAAGWMIQSEIRRTADSQIQLICSAVLVAIMTHLTFSGGWTIPGVAIVIWLMVGSICRTEDTLALAPGSLEHSANDSEKWAAKSGLVAFAVGAALLMSLRIESIVPVQTAQLSLLRADDAARRGSIRRVDAESRLAMEADQWGIEAPRWRSEFLKSQLVRDGDHPGLRETWLEANRTAIKRAGDNPLVWRPMGEQYLHLYQRYGRSDDLQQADRMISRALAGNPTDVSLIAQASMIALERSDRETSMMLAKKAARLSRLGENIVRALGLQQIYVVEKRGAGAASQPVLESIKDQFLRRLGLSDEPPDSAQRSNETSE